MTPPAMTPPPLGTLIVHGIVITMDPARRILSDGALRVVRDRIDDLGGSADLLARYPHDTVVDARGGIVIPGLIDTHVHLAQALIRGCADDMSLIPWLTERVWVLQGAYTPADGRVSARLCMAEMLKSGTTTFLESLLAHRYGFDGVAEAVVESGMRGCLGKVVMDIASYAGSPLCMAAGMIEDRTTGIDGTLAMHERWEGAGNGRVQVWFGARTPGGVSPSLYREIGDLARARGMGITIHLAEVQADLSFLRREYNQSPIEFADSVGLLTAKTVLAHGVWLAPPEFPRLAATGTTVSHNPSSNAKLASGCAPVPGLLASGVNVGMGCDGGPSNNTYDLIREMKLAAVVHKGAALDPLVVPAETVLEMATLHGARALGLQDEIGSLDVGKKADVVIVATDRLHLTPSFNPVSTLVYAASGADVRDVMVDGAWVVRDARLLTMDENEVIATARQHALALVQRAGLSLGPRWPVVGPALRP